MGQLKIEFWTHVITLIHAWSASGICMGHGAEAVSSTLEAVDYLEWDGDVKKNEESSSAWVLFSINKTYWFSIVYVNVSVVTC